ncbi:MAG: ATP phosphoribosyltransferase regulatory subunit [Clostridia bacterium]|nr:ATP phosphoribosyltransferase regulatory subunit [Clostridia bacterium]
MENIYEVMTYDEKIAFSLRSLYAQNGYNKYRMSKFEEYDLYVKNKDFLVSGNVITFTDTDGRLMALKPDVTLSIIKNSKDNPNELMKVYYNEHVYRVSKGTHSFKEIMQAGVECLGKVDNGVIASVLDLAKASLNKVSSSCALEISNLGIVEAVLDACGFTKSEKREIVVALGEKNEQLIKEHCLRKELSASLTDTVTKLVSVYGNCDKVLPLLDCFAISSECEKEIQSLRAIIATMKNTDGVIIDFSVTGDMRYYNGISFKGFVEGVPVSVLSGGQYDKLMAKMGRKSGAIGFAVYLDELDRSEGR